MSLRIEFWVIEHILFELSTLCMRIAYIMCICLYIYSFCVCKYMIYFAKRLCYYLFKRSVKICLKLITRKSVNIFQG